MVLAGQSFIPDLKDGEQVNPLLPYGIGIDTHRDFIQVCVITHVAAECRRFEQEFSTSWRGVTDALAWATRHARLSGDPCVFGTLRYTIESTGTYHVPVLMVWGQVASVVNPMLAGPTKRKTDVLDARMLAQQSLTGLWPVSFIASTGLKQLQVLLGMRQEASRNATRQLNRINNNLLRFGHTLGAEYSMGDATARAIIEDMCTGHVMRHDRVHPDGIPEGVRGFFKHCFELFDYFTNLRLEYHKGALDFIKASTWPMAVGTVAGKKLLQNLQTVPGVGEVTAMMWISVVGTPVRFENVKQVSAFCGCDPSLKVSAGKVTSHVKRKGNTKLRHVFKNVAAQLVRRRNEAFGIWGFSIMRRHAKGGWARAINAVSRRLACACWHVHRTGNEFSYEKYKLLEIPVVPDVPVDAMGLGPRVTRLLTSVGLSSSVQVAQAVHTTLPQQKGVGASCLEKVRNWLGEHKIANPQALTQRLPPVLQKPVPPPNCPLPTQPSEAARPADSSSKAPSTGVRGRRSRTKRLAKSATGSATKSSPGA